MISFGSSPVRENARKPPIPTLELRVGGNEKGASAGVYSKSRLAPSLVKVMRGPILVVVTRKRLYETSFLSDGLSFK